MSAKPMITKASVIHRRMNLVKTDISECDNTSNESPKIKRNSLSINFKITPKLISETSCDIAVQEIKNEVD